jgi:hypothetical protein
MRILIYDAVQQSSAPKELKSPALADKFVGSSVTIVFDVSENIDCVGVGYTDATTINVNGQSISLGSSPDKNGLYLLNTAIASNTLTVTHNGTYIGRFAAGKSLSIGVAPAREPKYRSTQENRWTLSGQRISGAGGYTYREIDVDVRYGLNQTFLNDVAKAYRCQIGRGYPLFILFDCETHRIPFVRFYGAIDEDIVLQSGVNRMLYSKKFSFREAF